MELIKIFENKPVIQEGMINPIQKLEDNIKIISMSYERYIPPVSLYNKYKAKTCTTVDNMLVNINENTLYVILNKTKGDYVEVTTRGFDSLAPLHKAMIATFNAFRDDVFTIFVPLGSDLFVEITPRQFRKLSMIKSVVFGENLNICNSDMFAYAKDSIDFTTTRQETCDDDNSFEAGVIAKAYHVMGFDVIKELCLYLYENKIKGEFIEELNILLDEAEGTNAWLKMSDVFIEYHTGDKLKMSFEAFKAIYYSVVNIEGGN